MVHRYVRSPIDVDSSAGVDDNDVVNGHVGGSVQLDPRVLVTVLRPDCIDDVSVTFVQVDAVVGVGVAERGVTNSHSVAPVGVETIGSRARLRCFEGADVLESDIVGTLALEHVGSSATIAAAAGVIGRAPDDVARRAVVRVAVEAEGVPARATGG